MPYVNPPVCYLCSKVHPCDTENTVQMQAPDGDTVNVCKDHPGVLEEYQRQNTLDTEGMRKLAMEALSHPRMQDYMASIREEMKSREDEFLNRMIQEGKRDEAMEILHGWKH